MVSWQTDSQSGGGWSDGFRCGAFIEDITKAEIAADPSLLGTGDDHDHDDASTSTAVHHTGNMIWCDEDPDQLFARHLLSMRYTDPRVEAMSIQYMFGHHKDVLWWCTVCCVALCIAALTDADALVQLYFLELILAAVIAMTALGFASQVSRDAGTSARQRCASHERLVVVCHALLLMGLALPRLHHQGACAERSSAVENGILDYCYRFHDSIFFFAKISMFWHPPRFVFATLVLLVGDVSSVLGATAIPLPAQNTKSDAVIQTVFMNTIASIVLCITIRGREFGQRERMEATARRYLGKLLLRRKKDRVNAVVCAMIPSSALTELIQRKAVRDFTRATMSVADIAQFTAWCSERTPQETVRMLNVVAVSLDDEAAHCGVKKLKTVGDAYLACCNIPDPCLDHPLRILRFAHRIHVTMHRISIRYRDIWGELLMRVGVHTGPVCGAILGRSSHLYDLYGTLPIIASALECDAVPGETFASSVTVAEAQSCAALDPNGGNVVTLLEGVTVVPDLNQEVSFASVEFSTSSVTFSARVEEVPFSEKGEVPPNPEGNGLQLMGMSLDGAAELVVDPHPTVSLSQVKAYRQELFGADASDHEFRSTVSSATIPQLPPHRGPVGVDVADAMSLPSSFMDDIASSIIELSTGTATGTTVSINADNLETNSIASSTAQGIRRPSARPKDDEEDHCCASMAPQSTSPLDRVIDNDEMLRALYYLCRSNLMRDAINGSRLMWVMLVAVQIVTIMVDTPSGSTMVLIHKLPGDRHSDLNPWIFTLVTWIIVVCYLGNSILVTYRLRTFVDNSNASSINTDNIRAMIIWQRRLVGLLHCVFHAVCIVLAGNTRGLVVTNSPSFITTLFLIAGPFLSIPSVGPSVAMLTVMVVVHCVVTLVLYGPWAETIILAVIVAVFSVGCTISRARNHLRYFQVAFIVERSAAVIDVETSEMERLVAAIVPRFIVPRIIRGSNQLLTQKPETMLKAYTAFGNPLAPQVEGVGVPGVVPIADDHSTVVVMFFHFGKGHYSSPVTSTASEVSFHSANNNSLNPAAKYKLENSSSSTISMQSSSPRSLTELSGGLHNGIHHEERQTLRADVNRISAVVNMADQLLLSPEFRPRWPLLEKVKVVDSSLMIAGPLEKDGSLSLEEQDVQVKEAAKQMISYALSLWQRLRCATATKHASLRVGIDAGPLVAGVVGIDHIRYDLFGTTVNKASRALSVCHTDTITVTDRVKKLLDGCGSHVPVYSSLSRGVHSAPPPPGNSSSALSREEPYSFSLQWQPPRREDLKGIGESVVWCIDVDGAMTKIDLAELGLSRHK